MPDNQEALRRIEAAFVEKIIGEEYRVLLVDNDEVRRELERKFNGDAYQWYPSVRVNEIVKKFAEHKYYIGEAHDRVTERVNRKSDREAKDLLIKLVDKNFEVGLKLLRES